MTAGFSEIEASSEEHLTPEELLSLASESAQEYDAEDVQPPGPMECDACVRLLGKGVRIYETIILVEQSLREAEARDEFDFTREMQDALIEVYETWLHGATKASRCVQDLHDRRIIPDNLSRFQSVVDRVQRSIELRKQRRDKYRSITGSMLRAAAEQNRPHPAWYAGEDDSLELARE